MTHNIYFGPITSFYEPRELIQFLTEIPSIPGELGSAWPGDQRGSWGGFNIHYSHSWIKVTTCGLPIGRVALQGNPYADIEEGNKQLDTIVTALHEEDTRLDLRELAEIQSRCQQQRKNWSFYFAGFENVLPYSGTIETARCRIETTAPHLLNEKPLASPFEGIESAEKCYSTLRRTQTRGEFYATVDAALQSTGMFEIVRNLNNDASPSQELYEASIPAYVSLRRAGYTRFPDLSIIFKKMAQEKRA